MFSGNVVSPPPVRTKKGIIFDLDGVLIQSAPVHVEAFNAVFADLNVPPISYTDIAGMATDKVFKKYLPQSSPEQIKEWTQRKRQIAGQKMDENLPVVPGLPDFLKNLSIRDVCLGIASSSAWGTVERFLGHLEKYQLTRDIFSCVAFHDGHLAPKPAPDSYLKVLQTMQIDAADVLCLEDSPVGVRAAQAAGIRRIVAVGAHDPNALRDLGVQDFLNDVTELEYEKYI